MNGTIGVLMEESVELLVEKARKGDRQAYGQLYKLYFNKIYRYCRINVKNEQAAEDISQDTFIRAWIAMPQFSFANGGTFQAFIFRIARNLIIDLSRKKKEVPLEYAEEVETGEDLFEDLNRKNEIEGVAKAFEKLNEDERQIIILRYFEDLSHTEVAKIVGVKEGALRVRTIRLLKKLKDLIKR